MQALSLVNTKEITREEWLESRMHGIGGSDAAAIMGLNPHSSPVTVWAEKTGRKKSDPDNEAMWLGRTLEEPVAKRMADESGMKIRRRNFILQHPEHEWMIANIDFEVVGAHEGVEVKTTSPYSKINFESGDVPPYYYVQCMHYLAVTGYDRWHLFVYVIGRGAYHFIVERDETEIASLIAQEQAFWEDNVLADIMPNTDGSEAAAKIISDRYTPATKETVSVIGADDDCAHYLELKAQISDLETELETVKQRLQIAVGEAQVGEAIDHIIKWTNTKGRTTVDSDRLKKEKPDIYKAYTKTGEPGRRFSVSRKGE